jgi:hypothetical protein
MDAFDPQQYARAVDAFTSELGKLCMAPSRLEWLPILQGLTARCKTLPNRIISGEEPPFGSWELAPDPTDMSFGWSPSSSFEELPACAELAQGTAPPESLAQDPDQRTAPLESLAQDTAPPGPLAQGPDQRTESLAPLSEAELRGYTGLLHSKTKYGKRGGKNGKGS